MIPGMPIAWRYFRPIVATGGIVTDITVDGRKWRVHEFLEDGTFNVSRVGSEGSVEYLVVAGGGAGGVAGGGAGGYRTSVKGEMSGGGAVAEAPLAVTIQSYAVVIGEGGTGADGNLQGNPGGNSEFGPITAIGGGSGGGNVSDPATRGGGSGGGGRNSSAPTGTGGDGVADQGFDGGSGSGANGGGGAGQPGLDGSSSTGGGNGLESSINGVPKFRAGGGGGGINSGSTPGGDGGGADGGVSSTSASPPNSGAGGGGNWNSNFGRAGGSGIVIIRYPLEAAP